MMRVILVFLLLFAGLFWSAPSFAGTCKLIGGNPSAGWNNGDWLCDDQGLAFAKASSMGVPSEYASCGLTGGQVKFDAASGVYSRWYTYPGNTCGIGYQMTLSVGSAQYPSGVTCASRSEEFSWSSGPPVVCHDGCGYVAYNDASVGKYWSVIDNATGQPVGVCTSSDHPEPKLDTDGDGVPDEDDAFPNDPNESKDSDGDGIGDNADFSPDDPKDGEDSGEGDEKDNKAAGGGDCKSPPSCSGDGIQCNQLYQLWRARCAVEGQGGSVTGSPGDCKAAYKCEGNSVACAQLAVQRQQLCGTGDGDGDGNGTVTGTGSCESSYVCTGGDAAGCAVLRETHKLRCALSKLTEGNGDDDFGEEHEPGDFFGVGAEGPDSGLLDDGGWLSARSCPATSDPVLSRLGGNVSEGLTALCDGASVLAAYVLILGFMHAAWILGRAVSGSAA